jgi:tripartite-type tricarboxylate transporter receptor subunit TctC
LVGVASAKRSPFFPDSPTLAEQGIKGAELDIWFGMWAPNGTPPEIIARLNRELAKVLAQPAAKERFANLGAEPAAKDQAAFRKLLADEGSVLASVIKSQNISADQVANPDAMLTPSSMDFFAEYAKAIAHRG